MVKFKCKISGNVVEFSEPFDIEQLRNQTMYYEELKEEIKKETNDFKRETITLKAKQ